MFAKDAELLEKKKKKSMEIGDTIAADAEKTEKDERKLAGRKRVSSTTATPAPLISTARHRGLASTTSPSAPESYVALLDG